MEMLSTAVSESCFEPPSRPMSFKLSREAAPRHKSNRNADVEEKVYIPKIDGESIHS